MTRTPSIFMVPPAGHVYAMAGSMEETLRASADRIRALHSNVTAQMIEIGRELAAVKDKTEHGLFLGWLQHEVGMEPRLAQKYMRAAEWAAEQENTKLVSHLQPTAIMELAAKSTPPTVVEAVASRVEAGEKVSPSDVRHLLREAREARDARREAEEEAKVSPRTKKAREERKAEMARRSLERIEKERAYQSRCDEERDRIAAILVRCLQPSDLTIVRASLLARHDDGQSLNIWNSSIFCGVFFSPMDKSIEAALAVSSTTDADDFVPPVRTPTGRDWEQDEAA